MTKSVSSFSVSFLVEVVGSDEWQDCSEGLLALPPPEDGRRISYALYPNYNYDIDVVIWPQVAKVWCRGSSAWVRTWLHLGRRWLAFSIRHALRLNVYEARKHEIVATIKDGIGNLGPEARNDKTNVVYVPKIEVVERRQFAKVIQDREVYYGLNRTIRNMLWGLIEPRIPSSHLDGNFDIPFEVTDIRHQDAILRAVEVEIFRNRGLNEANIILAKTKSSMMSKTKQSDKGKSGVKGTLEIKLSGDAVLSGLGYVTSETISTPEGMCSIFISSKNLPPKTEHPVFFVKIHKLHDLPQETLSSFGFKEVYTRWTVCDEEHCSLVHPLSRLIVLQDRHALPLEPHRAGEILTSFQDTFLEIEIRALREPSRPMSPKMFGTLPEDSTFGRMTWPSASQVQETHVTIAVCLLDLKSLITGNKIVRGCYPVTSCSTTESKILTAVILESSATLTLTVGFVGCRPKPVPVSYYRMICAPTDTSITKAIVDEIFEANEETLSDDLLTGWAVDWHESSIIFIEGPRDRVIDIWMKTIEFEPIVSSFSSDMPFLSRVYPRFIEKSNPFQVICLNKSPRKILQRPKLSTQAVLMLPARDGLLKIGRLEMCGVDHMWFPDVLPTETELRNLRTILEEESDLRDLFQ